MNYPFVASAAITTSRIKYNLPAFSYAVTWLGVSDRLATYPLLNETWVSLVTPIEDPDETFVLAVAWEVDGFVYRMKIFGEGVLHYPVYNGEAIGPMGVLEVWSAGVMDAEMEDDLTIYTSWLQENLTDYAGTQCDLPDVTIELTAEEPAPEPIPEECVVLAVQGSAELRTLSHVADQLRYLDWLDVELDGRGGEFVYNAASLAADDSVDVIKPDDVDALSPGRWERTVNNT